jgi:hypothetical protein
MKVEIIFLTMINHSYDFEHLNPIQEPLNQMDLGVYDYSRHSS